MVNKKPFEIFDTTEIVLTRGVNLVEASAGTGKTYAIAMLVLRALVELAVPIEKILVVTFTKAATEELKSRIRARIVEARDILADSTVQGEDTTLLKWLAQLEDRETAFARLQLALYDIDRACVLTIHGFCQRMLVEQALESGQLFDVELVADIDHVRNQVADDFWRANIYPLDKRVCSLLLKEFSTPEKLLGSVSQVFHDIGKIEPAVKSIDFVLERFDSAMEQMVFWFDTNGAELQEYFRKAVQEGCFKKTVAGDFIGWWKSLELFFLHGSDNFPDNLHFLSRQGLMPELNGKKIRGIEKKHNFLSDWPLADIEIEKLLVAVKDLVLAFRVHLAGNLRQEVWLQLEYQGTMGFNDLILRLARALEGERGQALVQVLAKRYDVALIDEFQDTDIAQYHIFSKLFACGDHYLYLIGDPKQAIYKFRGADINSYFMARDSAGKLLTLDKNYRSHPSLVQEINRLFSSRPDPFYLSSEIIDYHRVECGKDEDDIGLYLDDNSLAGMVYCYLKSNDEDNKGRWTSGKAALALMKFVTYETGRLLHQKNPAVLQKRNGRPLKPSDIAILVRSHSQATIYKKSLIEAGIPAVVGSSQSVFQTAECRELYTLIHAIAMPQEIMLLKSAMALSWFGLTGNTLHDLLEDEVRFTHWHNRFLDYNRMWQERGFLVMISELLVQENVFVTLAGLIFAERIIANIQHLIELIQEQESNENYGLNQTLQWLLRMMEDDKKSEYNELLLESDENAVRIVTMHGSKGLEYPVVFCPYLWYRTNRLKSEKYQVACHDESNGLIVDLGSDHFAEHRAKAIEEEMAEELRLLYVALTRAQVCCYVMWADVKASGVVADSFYSSLGYLLFPEGSVEPSLQQSKFALLAEENSARTVAVCRDEYPQYPVFTKDVRLLQPMLASKRSLHTDWQMSSYSAMAALSEYEYEKSNLEKEREGKNVIAVTGLPAGPNFGNVIHELLECVSFAAIADKEDYRELLRQKCKRYSIIADPADIEKLLEIVVTTPLYTLADCGNSGIGFSLADIGEENCLKEMDFYFHLSRFETDRINEILSNEPTVTPLSHRVMEGYLTGFVDLVCQHDGKYYIFDYKTNFLGESILDYEHAQLVQAMQAHNYGLQYWIYTLVLHRHLHNLIPEYSFEQHFGGVMYLFLRGMVPAIPGNGVYFIRPDYCTLLELDLAMGGQSDQ